MVLEKTLESPLDRKEIKVVTPKGNQPWIFIGRTDAEAPIVWPPDGMSWLIGKDPDAGKDCRQEETGVTENKMVEWHHQMSHEFEQTHRHKFEQTPGDGEGQGSLVCCSPWGCKELSTTWQLNNNKLFSWILGLISPDIPWYHLELPTHFLLNGNCGFGLNLSKANPLVFPQS